MVRVLLLLLALIPFGPGVASAQDPAVDRTAAARTLFEDGLAALDRGDFETAADRFERARVLRPSAIITYNLASALEGLGRLVRASELLRQVEIDTTADASVRGFARTKRAQVAARIARLTVRVPHRAEADQVLLDRQPIDPALLDVPIPIDPGEHVVAVRRGLDEIANRTVTLRQAAEEDLVIDVPAVVPGPEEAALRADPEESGERDRIVTRWWLWTILGAVVAGGVVAALLLTGGGGADPYRGNTTPRILFVGGNE